MEALKEIIEIFKEFDGNNVWIVIGISAVLLFIAAGYIQLLNASKIEAILMDQKEESKRFGFIYLILFAVFGIINYIFIIDIELVLANVVLWKSFHQSCGLYDWYKRYEDYRNYRGWKRNSSLYRRQLGTINAEFVATI